MVSNTDRWSCYGKRFVVPISTSNSQVGDLSLNLDFLNHVVELVGEHGALVVDDQVGKGLALSNVLHEVLQTVVGEVWNTVDPDLEGLKGVVGEGLSKDLQEVISDVLAVSEVNAQLSELLLCRETLHELLEDAHVDVSVLIEHEADVLKVIVLAEDVGESLQLALVSLQLHVEVDALTRDLVGGEVSLCTLGGVEVDSLHEGHHLRVQVDVHVVLLSVHRGVVHTSPACFTGDPVVTRHKFWHNIGVVVFNLSLDRHLGDHVSAHISSFDKSSTATAHDDLLNDLLLTLALLALEGVLVGSMFGFLIFFLIGSTAVSHFCVTL